MDSRENFDQGVGTYLKVIRFADPTNPDGVVVLSLRPGGRFPMAGYWPGYERSSAAGRWIRRSSEVHLDGIGHTYTDIIDEDYGAARTFSRILQVDDQYETPILNAAGELSGWSLLGWTGPFTYVGQRTVIDPDSEWLPGSLSAVDQSIDRLVPA